MFRQTGGIKILEMAQSNLLLYYEAEMPTEKQNSNCSKDNKLKLELKDQQNTQMWQFCLVKYKLSRLFWLKLTNWLEKNNKSTSKQASRDSQQSTKWDCTVNVNCKFSLHKMWGWQNITRYNLLFLLRYSKKWAERLV